MTFGDLVIQEDSGKLRIFPRTYPTAYSIDEGDLGAVIEGESRPGIIAFQDVASVELPRMLALEFKDKSSTDFEQASVTSRRNELTFDTNPAEFKFDRRTEVVNLPIIMTQATAHNGGRQAPPPSILSSPRGPIHAGTEARFDSRGGPDHHRDHWWGDLYGPHHVDRARK